MSNTEPAVDPTLALWSDLARNGRKYSERVANGESFLILHNSRPFALLVPITADQVSITVHLEEEAR